MSITMLTNIQGVINNSVDKFIEEINKKYNIPAIELKNMWNNISVTTNFTINETSEKAHRGPKKGKVTGYILYGKEHRAIYKEQGLSFAEISKTLGNHWKALTDSEREVYNKRAAELSASIDINPPVAQNNTPVVESTIVHHTSSNDNIASTSAKPDIQKKPTVTKIDMGEGTKIIVEGDKMPILSQRINPDIIVEKTENDSTAEMTEEETDIKIKTFDTVKDVKTETCKQMFQNNKGNFVRCKCKPVPGSSLCKKHSTEVK